MFNPGKKADIVLEIIVRKMHLVIIISDGN